MPESDSGRAGGGPGAVERQTTIRREIDCKGIGLHCGEDVRMTLCPAEADTGIVFRRRDLCGATVPARYDHVADTRLGTSLEGAGGARVGTVEHLMAALWGCGVDNLIVDVDGPEVPAMDGSAEPFMFLVDCAGLIPLDSPRQTIRVLRPVSVRAGDAHIALLPDYTTSLYFEILFDHPAVGAQSCDFVPINGAFRQDIARARTFGFERDVAALRASGLARGGSYDNAIIVGEQGVKNEEGLRFPDEFVRHKVLDCLGDLYLAGACVIARIEASRAGHTLNNRLLRALFSDPANWCFETDEKMTTPAHA